ncbi:MAG TPA: N-formylglutamate deformylase [Usitatibacter sp.]|nr:N-formylglutamate deformylase [Usitatibacter sp.]
MLWSERTVWPYRYRRGDSPLIVSMPHAGTFVPHSVGRHLDECAACRCDTDWHLPRLYDFLGELDATVIVANLSRYVIDVNRPPDGANLYPGHDTPKLCPTDTFDQRPLYRDDGPSEGEIARRLDSVWQPYQRRLEREIARVRAEHGIAVLWDAHSIVSVAPRLFEGTLPDFNLGTADGASCDSQLSSRLMAALARHRDFTHVLNGRFKGGYITRRHGKPADGVHAVQLEMAECIYMQESSPYTFSPPKAERIRPILREQLATAIDWAVNR